MNVQTAQSSLFMESIYDALRAVVDHAGGPKEVGRLLWPEKSVDDARRVLLDCLNPTRHEKFSPEQVLFLFRLGRDKGYHDALNWLVVESGYMPTEPADPATEQAQLARVVADAAETMRRAMAQFERINKVRR